MIRLVALDIDGTLLNPGVHVDDLPGADMTGAVRQLAARGIKAVLASGRMFPGTASVGRHLGLDGPLICQQGASVHNPDGSLHHGYTIDPTVALELLDYARQHAWPAAWFDSARYLVTHPCEQAQFFADVSQIGMEIDEQPELSGVQATGIDIISTAEMASVVHTELQARYGDSLSLLDFPSVTAIHAPEASKANALELIAAEMGVARSDILAIGDSVNDVSMLRWAGHSATPEHCDTHARKAAGEVLPGPGVAGVVARLNSLPAT